MDLSNPLSTVTPTLDAAVLRALAAVTRPAGAAEVRRRAGTGSEDGVRKVLRRLVAQGLVDEEVHRGLTLYRLNRDHLAAGPVVALARARSTLLERIGGAVDGWDEAPVHLGVFGSVARGEAGVDSDVDVLLVVTDRGGDRWDGPAGRLAGDVRRWTGNPGHVLQIDLATLAELVLAGDPLVDSWRADHLHLRGERLDALLRPLRGQG